VLPEMPEAQAKLETTHATAYVAANHTKWFWGGVAGRGTSCTARPASARVIRFNWLQDSRVVVVRLVHPRSRSAIVMGARTARGRAIARVRLNVRGPPLVSLGGISAHASSLILATNHSSPSLTLSRASGPNRNGRAVERVHTSSQQPEQPL
jgi:hypothetical protein